MLFCVTKLKGLKQMTDPNNENLEGTEDLQCAIREGRPLGHVKSFAVLVGNEKLKFKKFRIDDPVPLGRQILESAGLDADGDSSLFAILPNGDFEDVRLDENFDLRKRGAERFIAFCSDRDFRFELNNDQLQWGKPLISGKVLRRLAKAKDDESVFLEIKGGKDRLIEAEELVDLNEPGVERFCTAPKPDTSIEIIVNSRPKVVPAEKVTFEQIVQLAFPGQHQSNVVFSMTYRCAASEPFAGELGVGGCVLVKSGTIFNVTRTVQS